MPTAAELGTKITSERMSFSAWMTEHKAADGSYDLSGDNLAEFNKRNSAIAALVAEKAAQDEAERASVDNEQKLAPQGRVVRGEAPASEKRTDRIETKEAWGEAFQTKLAENKDVLAKIAKGSRGSVSMEFNTELKTLITTSDMAPQADRQPATGSALYFGNTEDLFMPGKTNSKSIDYYIQTTDTDNTATVAQGSAVTDSAFSWTLTTNPVETIQDWIPATRESLADNAGLQSIIEGLLASRLQKKVNSQLLAGDGNTPNLSGVSVVSGVQTQAKGSDTAFDAIHKAITLVEVTGDANVDAIVMHPTDWQNLRLTRTSQGLYILGNPAGGEGLALWGLPVRRTTGLGSAGTALVGAFGQYAQVFSRDGVGVEISTEHSTYFTERKVAIMLFRRLALADYRPSAFAKVTGL